MAERIVDTADGVFLVRDAGAGGDDLRGAAAATRIPGRRARRLLGVAGSVLRIRCAHQFSRPDVRVEVVDEEPARERPWR